MLTPFLPNRVAEPEEIADAVCWMASDESRNVTASRIPVDQGSTQYRLLGRIARKTPVIAAYL
jgi:NAD(P)-dependent dehydrogenase (short-subunit alcohol dehydrogenase family)